jgi:hypothetical protein
VIEVVFISCDSRLVDLLIAVETGSSRQVPREVNADIRLDSPTPSLIPLAEVWRARNTENEEERREKRVDRSCSVTVVQRPAQIKPTIRT